MHLALQGRVVGILEGEVRDALEHDGTVRTLGMKGDRRQVRQAPAQSALPVHRALELPGGGDHQIHRRRVIGLVDDPDLLHEEVAIRSGRGRAAWGRGGPRCGDVD